MYNNNIFIRQQVSENLDFFLLCLLVRFFKRLLAFKIDERVSKQDFR